MSWATGLIAARLRRQPGRYLMCWLGVAVAVAFAGSVLAEATIAADRAAHQVLAAGSAVDRSVRVNWQGPRAGPIAAQAPGALRRIGAVRLTETLQLNEVRLNGIVVTPAAISPLRPWLAASSGPLRPQPGRCRQRRCPMVLAGGGDLGGRTALSAFQLRIEIAGHAALTSAVPLGFAPAPGTGPDQPPLLLTGDVAGLDRLPGLSGSAHLHGWSGALALTDLHSWQLASYEQRLQALQQRLLAADATASFTGPFALLDAARARADAAPERLLLAGGGALAALAAFVVLAAGALRADVREELSRLSLAGAATRQLVMFAALEPAAVCLVAVACGFAGAVVVTAARGAEWAVIAHALLRWHAAAGAGAIWACAAAVIFAATITPRKLALQAGGVAAVAGAAALVLSLSRTGGGSDPLPLLLAPLACVTAGAVIFGGAASVLRSFERSTRAAGPLTRVALTGLARGPGLASLAIASIAVSTGLGGFALAYRATLRRSATDQAADRVPLDATVSAGADFRTPLQVEPLGWWRRLAGGAVLPVRRTDASYLNGGATVTVVALGVPATGLAALRGWRASDAAAPLRTLGRRLAMPGGAVRTQGPALPAGTRRLSLHLSSPALALAVNADLRAPDGSVTQVPLGTGFGRGATVSGRIPAGRWELEALELDEPTGLELTNGHQNAENPTATTRGFVSVRLGPVRALGAGGRTQGVLSIGRWPAVGAARAAGGAGSYTFDTSGSPGVIRPLQPTDTQPLPVLVDPRTAAATGPDGDLPLTIDGITLRARVAGVVDRFPTVPADAAGLVVADTAALAGALDSFNPGQGQPDELWLSTAPHSALRAALNSGPAAGLDSSFRADIERSLRGDPLARGVQGTLLAAASVGFLLAVAGLLLVLVGGARDQPLERDLSEQGVGPGQLRRVSRLRLGIASAGGLAAGLVVAISLTGLAVSGVRASFGPVQPAIVAVVPLAALSLWTAAVAIALAVCGWAATRRSSTK